VLRRLLDFLDAADVEGAVVADVLAASAGTMPAPAIASAAAVSTRNQVSKRR